MRHPIRRRDFLAASAAAGAGLLTAGRLGAAEHKTTEYKTKLYKALKGLPSEETFKAWKAAGFDGMDTSGDAGWDISPADAMKARKLAEKYGMKIHGVVRGWTHVNHPDSGVVANCRIGGMPMPKAWEFDIRFDEKTGHITQLVAGGCPEKYEKYVTAHDDSTDATRKAVAGLIPVAEKAGVVIAIENVWNNLWVTPDVFTNLVASFDSPWVQAYYDIGNHVKYALPELWIRSLGKLIIKCDVKDFKLNPNGQGGTFADIRDGSVDWPLVRKELDKIGFSGWMTIEGSDDLSLEDRSERLDLILAGK
jgi:hexulose-6-phosphate isomerase